MREKKTKMLRKFRYFCLKKIKAKLDLKKNMKNSVKWKQKTSSKQLLYLKKSVCYPTKKKRNYFDTVRCQKEKKNIAGHNLTSNLLKNQPGIIDANDQLVPLYQKKSKTKNDVIQQSQIRYFSQFPPFCTMEDFFFHFLLKNQCENRQIPELGDLSEKHFRTKKYSSHCANF